MLYTALCWVNHVPSLRSFASVQSSPNFVYVRLRRVRRVSSASVMIVSLFKNNIFPVEVLFFHLDNMCIRQVRTSDWLIYNDVDHLETMTKT